MNNNYTFQSKKKKKSGIILHFCKFSLKSGRTEDRFLIAALLLHSGCCNNMLFGLFLKTVQPRADMWFGKWRPHKLLGRASGTAVLRTHCDYHLLKLTRAHPWSWPGSDRTNCRAASPWGKHGCRGDTHDAQSTETIIATTPLGC